MNDVTAYGRQGICSDGALRHWERSATVTWQRAARKAGRVRRDASAVAIQDQIISQWQRISRIMGRATAPEHMQKTSRQSAAVHCAHKSPRKPWNCPCNHIWVTWRHACMHAHMPQQLCIGPQCPPPGLASFGHSPSSITLAELLCGYLEAHADAGGMWVCA